MALKRLVSTDRFNVQLGTVYEIPVAQIDETVKKGAEVYIDGWRQTIKEIELSTGRLVNPKYLYILIEEEKPRTLEDYLRESVDEHVIDFRIRASIREDKVEFYIHPHGVSGDTLDFTVEGNTLTLRNMGVGQ